MNINSKIATTAAVSRSEFLFSERYQWLSQYHGDKKSKAHASEVKRTASVLRKAQQTFDILLDHTELEALRIAAQVLDGLGKELDQISSKARAPKKVRMDSARLRREELAESCALRRWGADNEAMFAEAKQLAEFVDNRFRCFAFDWVCELHGVSYATRYHRDPEFGPKLSTLLQQYVRIEGAEPVEIRMCAGEYINALQESGATSIRLKGSTWTTGLDDFEAWKARKDESYMFQLFRSTVAGGPAADAAAVRMI